MTMVKCTNAGGRTKGANERSIVFVHQHGGDDVTWKPPIERNFRSRHAKFVYYNYKRVECGCHVSTVKTSWSWTYSHTSEKAKTSFTEKQKFKVICVEKNAEANSIVVKTSSLRVKCRLRRSQKMKRRKISVVRLTKSEEKASFFSAKIAWNTFDIPWEIYW